MSVHSPIRSFALLATTTLFGASIVTALSVDPKGKAPRQIYSYMVDED